MSPLKSTVVLEGRFTRRFTGWCPPPGPGTLSSRAQQPFTPSAQRGAGGVCPSTTPSFDPSTGSDWQVTDG